jgi:hypothetical protein
MEKAIEKFLINLANLIKVKTIITLVIICGVTYGFVVGLVQPEVYCTLAGSIVTYYFTKKKETDI